MNINELKAEIARNGMNLGDYAKLLGVTNTTITNRLKDPGLFQYRDIKKTVEAFELDGERILKIFFDI